MRRHLSVCKRTGAWAVPPYFFFQPRCADHHKYTKTIVSPPPHPSRQSAGPPWRFRPTCTASVQVVDYEYKVLLSRGFDLEAVHPTEHISLFLSLTGAPFQVRCIRACWPVLLSFCCLLLLVAPKLTSFFLGTPLSLSLSVDPTCGPRTRQGVRLCRAHELFISVVWHGVVWCELCFSVGPACDDDPLATHVLLYLVLPVGFFVFLRFACSSAPGSVFYFCLALPAWFVFSGPIPDLPSLLYACGNKNPRADHRQAAVFYLGFIRGPPTCLRVCSWSVLQSCALI